MGWQLGYRKYVEQIAQVPWQVSDLVPLRHYMWDQSLHKHCIWVLEQSTNSNLRNRRGLIHLKVFHCKLNLIQQLTSSLLMFLSLQTSVISRYASSRLAAMKLRSYLLKTNKQVHVKLPSVTQKKSYIQK